MIPWYAALLDVNQSSSTFHKFFDSFVFFSMIIYHSSNINFYIEALGLQTAESTNMQKHSEKPLRQYIESLTFISISSIFFKIILIAELLFFAFSYFLGQNSNRRKALRILKQTTHKSSSKVFHKVILVINLHGFPPSNLMQIKGLFSYTTNWVLRNCKDF